MLCRVMMSSLMSSVHQQSNTRHDENESRLGNEKLDEPGFRHLHLNATTCL